MEVVMFTAEEPTRFGIGVLEAVCSPQRCRWKRRAPCAIPKVDRWTSFAQKRDVAGNLESVRLPNDCYRAFVELHIEQGPQLERAGIPIGIVEKIAGPSSYRVTITGEGGHAGAVLMSDRHDASLAAAEIALAVEHGARNSGSPDTVGTTAYFASNQER
jgi:N-carbamoyl-L-amino-acid hydrolase